MRNIERDIVGAFIFSSDEQLLLGKVAVYEGCWAVPGGGIEEGETRQEALIREISEETGIDISQETIEELPDPAYGTSEKTLKDTGERVLVHMKFFDFKITLGSPAAQVRIIAEDDFKDAQWFPLPTLGKLELTPPTRVRLGKLGLVD